MAVDHIRYDILTQDALRALVRQVLSDVAKTGSLPGEHHFYISLETRAPGVQISPRLREQYPEEITIVLQHQFWDLAVREDSFEVGLAFGGVPERLVVPFAAIKSFFDPSVKFGLQFESISEEQAGGESSDTAATAPGKPARSETSSLPVPAASEATQDNSDAASDRPTGAEVVSLDRFRKK